MTTNKDDEAEKVAKLIPFRKSVEIRFGGGKISLSSKLFRIALALFLSIAFAGADRSLAAPQASTPPERTLRFTVLYDSYVFNKGTKTDWGFSCLIEGTEKTILFDTGYDPRILMHNVNALNVDLKKVEQIVVSHEHDDHTGGLFAVLDRNPNVTVFFPHSFPVEFRRRVESLKAKAQTVDKPVEICQAVYLTGETGDQIKEQSLVIDSPKGLIVVTGCSHQGIVNILKRAKDILDKPIYLVFGGFHLGQRSEAEMQEIIAAFKDLKVEKCGATHCTGDGPIAMFKKAFGENYMSMGTGRIIEVPGF